VAGRIAFILKLLKW